MGCEVVEALVREDEVVEGAEIIVVNVVDDFAQDVVGKLDIRHGDGSGKPL